MTAGPTTKPTTEPLLSVRDLVVEFDTDAGRVRAVDGVSFDLHAGQTLGVVGESGCGKSVTSLAVMGLIPDPPGRIASGSIRLGGQELVGLPESRLRKLRGSAMSMIFQEPMTAMNPVYSIGRQLGEVLRRHDRLGRSAARARAVDMLERVGIPRPAERLGEYPHELSGGMRQRVMIAMALACRPELLIADEPTTALDVTTQAQVLAQIRELSAAMGTAVILVTHDLGVVAESCDTAAVMYCGRIVERAPVAALFAQPRHRYTEGLIESVPRIRSERTRRLPVIPGTVPEPGRWPHGCRFADRCRFVEPDCRAARPELRWIGDSEVACLHPAAQS